MISASSRRAVVPSVEPLEARIAPAGFSLTYTDLDGDLVTVKVSRGTYLDAAVVFKSAVGAVTTQLQELALKNSVFEGANVSITAKPQRLGGALEGDGMVNVGFIDAVGVDLGTVVVHGDLGRLLAGGGALGTGVKALSVGSLGTVGTSTQAAGGDLQTTITGELGALAVAGDVKGAAVKSTGPLGSVEIGGNLLGDAATGSGKIASDSSMGNVTIGGLIRGDGDYSGLIQSNGPMGAVKIGGGLIGGLGKYSGAIFSPSTIASVTIGTALRGDVGDNSGSIEARGDLGAVKIGTAATPSGVTSGSGPESGRISTQGKLKTLTIYGPLQGMAGEMTDQNSPGQVFSKGDMGAVHITGDVTGTAGLASGTIFCLGNLASVTLGGGLIGSDTFSGAIGARGNLGPVKITGDLRGGDGTLTGIILAGGNLASVSIGGGVFGGDGLNSGGIVGSHTVGSKVGPVKIGGDLQGGDGATDSGKVSGYDITSVTIGGSLLGGKIANNTSPGESGFIEAAGKLGPVKITVDIKGGAGGQTGYIHARSIASVTVGGSVSSHPNAAYASDRDGWICADNEIGTIIVKGSILGTADKPVIISGGASSAPTSTRDLAIKSIAVTHDVAFAEIRAGYTAAQTFQNANAQIGNVTIGGNWDHGRISAGSGPGQDGHPGSNDDVLAGTISRIASVVIKGFATGGGTDYFIDSGKVGSITVHAVKALLTAGPDTLNVGGTLPVQDLR